eukprot:ctg_178.g136
MSSFVVTRPDGTQTAVRWWASGVAMGCVAGKAEQLLLGARGGDGDGWSTAQVRQLEDAALRALERGDEEEEEEEETVTGVPQDRAVDGRLWVDRYAPLSFAELLGDARTHRELLKWLVGWARSLGTRPRTLVAGAAECAPRLSAVALLVGAPGAGKTTVAQVLARHAGFEPMHVNASEERTAQSLEWQVREALTARSLRSGRRHVILLDEADGLASQGSGGGGGGDHAGTLATWMRLAERLRAGPVLCIANDEYARVLRPLRSSQVPVFRYQKPAAARLTQRLHDIAAAEGLDATDADLELLSQVSEGDIRAALNCMQFLRSVGGVARCLGAAVRQGEPAFAGKCQRSECIDGEWPYGSGAGGRCRLGTAPSGGQRCGGAFGGLPGKLPAHPVDGSGHAQVLPRARLSLRRGAAHSRRRQLARRVRRVELSPTLRDAQQSVGQLLRAAAVGHDLGQVDRGAASATHAAAVGGVFGGARCRVPGATGARPVRAATRRARGVAAAGAHAESAGRGWGNDSPARVSMQSPIIATTPSVRPAGRVRAGVRVAPRAPKARHRPRRQHATTRAATAVG